MAPTTVLPRRRGAMTSVLVVGDERKGGTSQAIESFADSVASA